MLKTKINMLHYKLSPSALFVGYTVILIITLKNIHNKIKVIVQESSKRQGDEEEDKNKDSQDQ